MAVGFRQRRQHHSIRHELGGFRQRLNETQIAVVRAPAERLTLHKLTDVNDQLIQQHHARRIASQQGDKHLLAGRRSVGVGFLHQCKPLGLAELPRQFTPKGADGLLALFPRLARCVGGAVEHRDLRLWHIHQAGLIEECGNPNEVAQRTPARGQVIHREQRVRLAATKSGLQLDDGLAAPAIEALRDLGKQSAHALGNEGAFVECLRVAVLRRRLTRAHCR